MRCEAILPCSTQGWDKNSQVRFMTGKLRLTKRRGEDLQVSLTGLKVEDHLRRNQDVLLSSLSRGC